MPQVRSDNRGLEGAAETTQAWDVTDSSRSLLKWVLEERTVTSRTIASNKGVIAFIIPLKRLPCAWTGPGWATTRTKRCAVEEDLGQGVEEKVQSGSTRRKVRGVGKKRGSRQTGATQRDCDGGNFPDVRFHATLNFGLFGGRPLEDVCVLPHPKFSSVLGALPGHPFDFSNVIDPTPSTLNTPNTKTPEHLNT